MLPLSGNLSLRRLITSCTRLAILMLNTSNFAIRMMILIMVIMLLLGLAMELGPRPGLHLPEEVAVVVAGAEVALLLTILLTTTMRMTIFLLLRLLRQLIIPLQLMPPIRRPARRRNLRMLHVCNLTIFVIANTCNLFNVSKLMACAMLPEDRPRRCQRPLP